MTFKFEIFIAKNLQFCKYSTAVDCLKLLYTFHKTNSMKCILLLYRYLLITISYVILPTSIFIIYRYLHKTTK